MVSVLLTLLKICGIILLSLLGLLLVLLLIVLFVPVRYRLKGCYKENFICHGKITWLLRIVSVSFDYVEEFKYNIRLFGIDISSFLNKPAKPDKAVKTDKATKSDEPNTAYKAAKSKMQDKTGYTSDTTGPNKDRSSENNQNDSPAVHSQKTEESANSQSIFDKIRDFITGIKNKFIELFTKVQQILSNIKNGKTTLDRYISILKREDVKPAFLLCKNRILKLILHLLPNKMKINAHIGMEDPATTGYILAFYSILPDKKKKQIILHPEFNDVVMEMDYNIKGAVYAFRLLLETIKILTDKNCRTLYKLVKKEISNERN